MNHYLYKVAMPVLLLFAASSVKAQDRIDNSANDVLIDFGPSPIHTATCIKLSVGNGITIQFVNRNATQWYTINKF